MTLASAIYEGRVQHRRFLPVGHRFAYRTAMLYLDLDELPTLFAGRWLWSTGGLAPFQVRRRDLLGPAHVPLKDAVLDVVQQHLGRRPDGPVRVLTTPRMFWFTFNPVSFYYVFDRGPGATERLAAVVAEITNTPWRQRHRYVVAADAVAGPLRASFAKRFHVSPFLPMGLRYDWVFSAPGPTLTVAMADRDGDAVVFDAALALERRELDAAGLRRYCRRHPWLPGVVTAAIYWHAARLWWRGVPFHPHPDKAGAKEVQVS